MTPYHDTMIPHPDETDLNILLQTDLAQTVSARSAATARSARARTTSSTAVKKVTPRGILVGSWFDGVERPPEAFWS
ncbi:hypothetical protein [Streptomyces mutabilis]|uniref:hypothetical protein n=1 Tax=Streptomyces mutabilis TaxID=67332 RepID=UPI0034DE4BB8